MVDSFLVSDLEKAPRRHVGKKKAKKKRNPSKKKGNGAYSAKCEEPPGAEVEVLGVLEEPVGIEHEEVVKIEIPPERNDVISELAESLREIRTKAIGIAEVKALQVPDDEDPYDLDNLVMIRDLTPSVIKMLARLVERGSDVTTACNKYLIDRNEVQKWRVLGESVLSGAQTTSTPHDEMCVKFVLAMLRASGRYEAYLDEGVHSEKGFARFIQIAKLRHPALYGDMASKQGEEFSPDEAFA